MSEFPSVTVVVPAYNRREMLGWCLDSINHQTCPPQTVILIDDGSTDGTAEWTRENYPGVVVVEQKNQGVSASRNTGIRNSVTDWIAFLDSDDSWAPEKLEKQMSALKQNPEYKLCHTEESWVFQGRKRPVAKPYRKKGGWIFEDCLPLCAISPSTVVIHRSVFDEVGLFDESLPACEDYDLWLRITARMPVLLVDEALIEKNGGHKDQLSAQWGLDEYRIRALQKILNEPYLSPPYRKLANEQLREKCRIYANGLEKHGKQEEAEYYRKLAQAH